MSAEEILKMPIEKLGLGDHFNISCRKMACKKLEDIVLIPPNELVKKPGFNYQWLGTLSKYLEENGLLHLLQPLPGSNHV